uniref:Uncharacterized protein n=1 Tax=Nomascus leucogenys TaxID=61853 RepID=A0A2I3HFK4_NOMLE
MLGLPGLVLKGGDVGSRAPPVCGENGFPGTDRALRTLILLPFSFPPPPEVSDPAFEGTFE